MKCAAKTKNGLCSRNHHSGCTVESMAEKWVYYMCSQHYTMVQNGKDVELDKSANRGHKLVKTNKEPGQIARTYLDKEITMNGTNRYYDMSIEDIAKLINHVLVAERANEVYGTNYTTDDVRIVLHYTGQLLDNAKPGYVYNGSDYIAHIRPELGVGVIMFNRGDEAITFPIDEFLKTAEDEGEPPEYDDYGPDDDTDTCEDEDNFIVAGTGSRSLKTADPAFKAKIVEYVEARLTRLKDRHGDRLVIMSGMAEGWDELLAITAKKLGIRLWVYIPNKGYGGYYWGQNSLTGNNRIRKFNELKDYAEKVEYTLEDRLGMEYDYDRATYYFTKGYAKGLEFPRKGNWGLYAPTPDGVGTREHSNFARNRAMVEDADAFLVWDPSSSGTAHAFGLIKKSHKPFEICNTKVQAV